MQKSDYYKRVTLAKWEANPELREAHRRKAREFARKRRESNLPLVMWQAAKTRASEKGLEFNIQPDDVTIPTHCPLLGTPILVGQSFSHREAAPTLDRIDNSKGYVKGNVWVISYRANRIKTDATVEELETVAANLRKRLT